MLLFNALRAYYLYPLQIHPTTRYNALSWIDVDTNEHFDALPAGDPLTLTVWVQDNGTYHVDISNTGSENPRGWAELFPVVTKATLNGVDMHNLDSWPTSAKVTVGLLILVILCLAIVTVVIFYILSPKPRSTRRSLRPQPKGKFSKILLNHEAHEEHEGNLL